MPLLVIKALFRIVAEKVPTMKSQGAAKNEANNAEQKAASVESIFLT